MVRKRSSFVDWKLVIDPSFMKKPSYRHGLRISPGDPQYTFPKRYQKPKFIFVSSSCDLFHESVPDKYLRRLWDTMWLYPRHTFLIVTKYPVRMRKFLRHWGCVRHFGWVDAEKDPIRQGDIIDLDTLWGRDVCGWKVFHCEINNGYGCAHPGNEDRENKRLPGPCDTYSCPIACELDEEDDECRLDPGDDDYVDPDSENMRLYERPRHGFVENVWLGVEVENQETADERIPTLLCSPASYRFAVVEPMKNAVDLKRIFWHKAFDDEPESRLNALTGEPFSPPADRFNCAGCNAGMKLDWIICTDTTGRMARSRKADWIRAVRDQCVQAGVPFYFKGFEEFKDDESLIEKPRVGYSIDGLEWKQIPQVVKK